MNYTPFQHYDFIFTFYLISSVPLYTAVLSFTSHNITVRADNSEFTTVCYKYFCSLSLRSQHIVSLFLNILQHLTTSIQNKYSTY